MKNFEGAFSLTVFGHVPPGCVLHIAPDDRNAPHVRVGDVVVVNTKSRTFAEGELFLAQFGTHQVVSQATRTSYMSKGGSEKRFKRKLSVVLRPMNRPPPGIDLMVWLRERGGVGHLSTPLADGQWSRVTVGQVIGLYQPDLDPNEVPVLTGPQLVPAGDDR